MDDYTNAEWLAALCSAELCPRLVQRHLLHCHDCREEFEALLDALRALMET